MCLFIITCFQSTKPQCSHVCRFLDLQGLFKLNFVSNFFTRITLKIFYLCLLVLCESNSLFIQNISEHIAHGFFSFSLYSFNLTLKENVLWHNSWSREKCMASFAILSWKSGSSIIFYDFFITYIL